MQHTPNGRPLSILKNIKNNRDSHDKFIIYGNKLNIRNFEPALGTSLNIIKNTQNIHQYLKSLEFKFRHLLLPL